MALEDVVPMLQARSLRETIEFYTTTLGFECRDLWPNEGEPGWCRLERDGAALMFYEDPDSDQRPEMTGVVYFYPQDVDSLWAELESKTRVEVPLQAMGYGMREFRIFDCNGYVLAFGQSVS